MIERFRVRGHRATAAVWLATGAILSAGGCRSELKTGIGPPPGPVSQLSIGTSTVHFEYAPGTAFPAPVPVVITGTPSLVDGLVLGTVLYSPICSGWLSADFGPGGGSTPTTVVLTATPPADLAPGSYVASVPIGSSVTGVITQFLVATLIVDPAPFIGLSPGSVTIGVTQGGGNPAPQFVEIDNAGSGNLTGLSAGNVVYGQGATGWLSASLNQATAPATLTLQATTGTIPSGTYTAQIPIASTVPGVAPVTIYVTLGVSAVTTPPTIAVSPTTVQVTAIAAGANPGAQPVAVSNGGGGSLTGLAVGAISYGTGANAWLNASINQAAAPATISVQAQTAGLVAGTYTANVQVTSSLAGVSPAAFTVSFTVASAPQPPVINLAPAAAGFNATAGGANPVPISVAVTNGGGGSLGLLSLGTTTYGPGATGWLNATLGNTTAPATITLTATLGSLAGGTYTATVPVSSGVSGVAAKAITVSFIVVGAPTPPAIGLAPTSVAFAGQAGGANPAARTVAVTNAGSVSLTGLATGTIAYGSGQPAGWLSASISPTTAPATITLQAAVGALAPGSYTATVPVTSAVASNSPKNIQVTFAVTGAPALVLTPSSMIFTGTTGQPNPSPGVVNITNNGAGVLTGLAAGGITYGFGQPTGWLATSLSGTSTPSSLVLSPSTGTLPAGTYTASVPLTTTTSGVASKSVSVSFQIAAPGGGMVILGGDAQTGLVDSILPIKLTAQVLDAASNPRSGVLVIWQVNNGGQLLNVVSTSDALGIVSATWKLGPLAGTHTTTVSSAGLPTLTFQADVQLPRNPRSHPNEPLGYVAFAEHNFSSLPTTSSTLGALLGKWGSRPGGNLTIVTPDLTAPESPPNTLQSKFPNGFPSGSAPVSMSGWDAAGQSAGQKSKIYLSYWIKIAGPDYENQAVLTKMGFVGYGQPINLASNQGFFVLLGTGTQAIQSAFNLQFRQQNLLARNLAQNVDSRALMTCGVWHQWESVLELNTLGQSDGKFRMWIDGIKILDYSDVVYITAGNTLKFNNFVWNPTWGGRGGTRTRDDYILMDHVYISGVP